MRVGIAFDPPAESALGPAERLAAEGSLAQVEQVEAAARALGHTTLRLPFREDLGPFVRRLEAERPPVVFNLTQGHCCGHVARLLELTGLPYTGSGPLAIDLTTDKALTKDVLAAQGVAVPAYRALSPLDPPGFDRFPAIVKPLAEDNSLGIDDGAVVRDEAALRRRVAGLRRVARPPALIVEELLEGRELSVPLLTRLDGRLDVLPIYELDFRRLPAGRAPINSFRVKWYEWDQLDWLCPAPLEPALRRRVEAVAVAAYRALGCRDYARVDLRLDAHGAPRVLEVNTNPDLQAEGGFCWAASHAGLAQAQVVGRLVELAAARAC